MRFLGIASVLVLVLALTPSTFACSCGGIGQCQPNGTQMPANAIAFVGTVQAVGTSGPVSVPNFPRGQSGVGITFRITENLKGTTGDAIVIYDAPGSCTYPFQPGMEYLVFADPVTRMIMPCAGIGVARALASRIEQLRAIRDGRPLAEISGLVLGSLVGYGYTGTSSINQTLANAKTASAVNILAKSGTTEYRTRTTDSGLYEFRGLPPGNYTVTLDPPAAGLPLQLNASQPGYSLRLNAAGSCRADFRLN